MINSTIPNIATQHYTNSYANKKQATNSNNALNQNTSLSQSNPIQTTISTLVQDKSKAVSQVLGYGVDKEGFFTSDFNEAAGLPKDYKIHAEGAKKFVNFQQSSDYFLSTHTKVDFAKTLGNAYKVFSQLAPQTLNSSFSKEELENLPYAFSMDKNFNVIKTYSKEEYLSKLDDGINKNLSFNTLQSFGLGLGSKFVSIDNDTIFNTSGDVASISKLPYINNDKSVSKGGVLMAFLNNSGILGAGSSFLSGETKILGKFLGLDSSITQIELKEFKDFMSTNRLQSPFLDISLEGNNALDLMGSRFSMSLFISRSENTKNSTLVKEAREFVKEYEDMFNSNMSLDEFKEKYLDFKQRHDKFVARLKASEKELGLDYSLEIIDHKALQTNTKTNKTTFTPIQAESKNETYKAIDTNELLKKLLEESFDEKDFLKMLFGIKDENLNLKSLD
ncbi:hypothetical protein DMB95_09535, partial [Campylobacter sp. MIT 12-8780]